MNYVLLGSSESVLPLLAAIGRSETSKLLGAAVCDGIRQRVVETNPTAKLVAQWEDLISLDEIDAVIVAGSHEKALAAARQLAANERSVVVVPDMGTGSVFMYELSLIRDEIDIELVPALPLRAHPAIAEFKSRIASDRFGKVIQLQGERRAEPDSEAPVFAKSEIESHLLGDVDLLRLFGGEYNQVTAIQTGKTETGAAAATVTLAGSDLAEAVWNLNSGSETWSVTVVGESGKSTLKSTGDANSLQIDDELFSVSDDELGNRWLRQIESGLNPVSANGETISKSESADGQMRNGVNPTLTQLTRAFEVVEGTRDSLRRRRTIDLYFETTSERSLFKTQMAAMGCLVLTWTLFGMIAFLVAGSLISGTNVSSPEAAEAQRELSAFEYWMWHILRVVWLAPIVIFAFSQLLLVLAKPARKPTQTHE